MMDVENHEQTSTLADKSLMNRIVCIVSNYLFTSYLFITKGNK